MLSWGLDETQLAAHHPQAPWGLWDTHARTYTHTHAHEEKRGDYIIKAALTISF